jgi:hypothetical protein
MGKTVQKIGGYAAIITVMSAMATAPAQAISQENILELQNEVTPEFDDTELAVMVEPTTIMTQLQSLEEEEVKVTDSGTIWIPKIQEEEASIYASNIHTTTWTPEELPARRRVPEPSAVLGLSAALCVFALQRLTSK